MDFDRHCDEIVTQTDLLVAALDGVDPQAPVPSCPGWTITNLLRHVGGGHRWAEEPVRTRSPRFLPDDPVRNLDGEPVDGAWLQDGARRLAATLRAAGPNAPVWTPLEPAGTASFFGRRFAHETLLHRADALLAVGAELTVAQDVALDALDEWMWLDALPQHLDHDPHKREVLGAGRSVSFEATDVEASWFVDLGGEVVGWRHGGGDAAVTVRAPLTGLVLFVYRRSDAADVAGDHGLLELWRRHSAFG